MASVPWQGWCVLVAVCALPYLLTLLGGAARSLVPRGPSIRLPTAAGAWLEAVIAARGLPVTVEVHAEPGIDAYIPGARAIGLTPGTYTGRSPEEWAVAAHELGHAQTSLLHPLLADLLPVLRLLQGLLWRAFCATLGCAALLHSSDLLSAAWALLVGASVVSLGVLADEASASAWAVQSLRGAGVAPAARRAAAWSMAGSLTAYGLLAFGKGAVLVTWPALTELLPGGAPASLPEPGPLVLWLAVVLVPVLLLRAAHVVLQVIKPEPVTTDFRLFSVTHREGQWEFVSGIGALVLVVGLHAWFADPVGSIALALAASTAIAPAAGFAWALLVIPALLVFRPARRASVHRNVEGRAVPGTAPEAVMAMYSNPPWYLRARWLAHLAYLPLIGLLVYRWVA